MLFHKKKRFKKPMKGKPTINYFIPFKAYDLRTDKVAISFRFTLPCTSEFVI
jgi:hypothetical protein